MDLLVQTIEHAYLAASCQQGAYEVAADETSASGDQDCLPQEKTLRGAIRCLQEWLPRATTRAQ
jgi:hypothetical protein